MTNKISVIISTYNGAHKIPHILKALQEQSYRDFEIVIMIDGSTDGTEKVANEWRYIFDKYFVHTIKNSGRSIIRNTGASLATGDLLLFFDDDMRPLPSCIEMHMNHHNKHHGSILSGGLSEDLKRCTEDIHRYKVYLSEKWTAPLSRLENIPMDKSNFFLTAANLSISKSVFEGLSGFNEKLTDAEDFELGLRAIKKNIQLFYSPKAFAWHDDYKSMAELIKRHRQYALMNDYLRKQGIVEAKESRVNTMGLSNYKKIFFRIFAYKFWINSIDKVNIWSILPKFLRYRIYDWVITSNGTYFINKVKL